MRKEQCALIFFLTVPSVSWSQTTTLESVNPSGIAGNGSSYEGKLSSNGRFVVFQSRATNLLNQDQDSQSDIYLRDRENGLIQLVSVSSAGVKAGASCTPIPPGSFGPGGESVNPAISGDGRFIVFSSLACNLDSSDSNASCDVFVRDLQTGTTRLVSADAAGVPGNGPSGGSLYKDIFGPFYSLMSSPVEISEDGRYVAFFSLAGNLVPNDLGNDWDLFVKDLQTNAIRRIPLALGASQTPNGGNANVRLSSDGRFLAFFASWFSIQVFVYDLQGGPLAALEPVSLSSSGATGDNSSQLKGFSDSGRFVLFLSTASNLVTGLPIPPFYYPPRMYRHDRQTGQTTLVSTDLGGAAIASFSGAMSGDGNVVAFSTEDPVSSEDTNGHSDVLIKDLTTGQASFASTNAAGTLGDKQSDVTGISRDGRFVAFTSLATNLVTTPVSQTAVQAYVKDRISLKLEGTAASLSPVHFSLSNATGETGNPVLVLLSCSGTAGIPLPGGKSIPLTFDGCTGFGLQLPMSLFLSGQVDGQGGTSFPTFAFPGVPSGIPLYAAAVTVDSSTFAVRSITGPVSFQTQ